VAFLRTFAKSISMSASTHNAEIIVERRDFRYPRQNKTASTERL